MLNARTLPPPLKRSATNWGGDPSFSVGIVVLSAVLFLGWLHPSPLLLPVLSIALVLIGLAYATVVALIPASKAIRLERLQRPALILFFGFAAAMVGDPDPAIQSLQQSP